MDAKNLASALEKLESTITGRPIAEAIRARGTTIKFGATDEDAIAQFDPMTNQITIHESLKNASLAIVAARLAHEGTHVVWNEPGSIDQEYHAFKAQAHVWNELKGNETNSQCDAVSAVIDRGEDRAKIQIRRVYPELPEFYP